MCMCVCVSEKATLLKLEVAAMVSRTVETDAVQDALSKIQNKMASASGSGVVEGSQTVIGWEGGSNLDETNVEAESSCDVLDVKFHPANMKGTRGVSTPSVEAWQKLCADTPDCAHFSFWQNHGCHRQDASATMMRASQVIAGPLTC